MKVFNNIYRIVNSALFGFKYLKNPLVIFEIPFKKEIQIELKNGEKIKIKRHNFVHIIEIFQKGWSYEGNTFNKNYKIQVSDFLILLENFDKMYGSFELKDKNILDIGAYCGDTALYFIFDKKAKKVFLYEPIQQNFNFIKNNTIINKCEKKMISYNVGVSNNNEIVIINSDCPIGSTAFGLPGNKYSAKIKVESWDTILERHKKDNIYLAKVDCEGGEKYLVDANKELIKKIPNWVMETHSSEIEKNMIQLFESLGYKKELRDKVNNEVKVWSFYL